MTGGHPPRQMSRGGGRAVWEQARPGLVLEDLGAELRRFGLLLGRGGGAEGVSTGAHA